MINSVEIENFKSIKKANLEFGKVTTIIGPSETGKSNFNRALHQLFYNGGCDMEEACFHGTKGFKIKAGISDGGTAFDVEFTKVMRLKKAEEKGWLVSDLNRYRVETQSHDDPAVHEEIHDKPGIYVPEPVEKIFQMSQVEFDKDIKLSLNLRPQHEGIIFLTLSPDKKALLVGKISPVLNALSSAYKAAMTDMRSAEVFLNRKVIPQIAENQANLELFKTKQEKLSKKLEVFKSLKEYVDSFQTLVDLMERYKLSKFNLDQVEKVLDKANWNMFIFGYLESAAADWTILNNHKQLEQDLADISVQYGKLVNLEVLAQRLIDDYNQLLSIADYRDLAEELDLTAKLLEEGKQKASAYDEIASKFALFVSDITAVQQESAKLAELAQQRLDVAEKYESAADEKVRLEKELQEVYKQYEACPVCGSEKQHWKLK